MTFRLNIPGRLEVEPPTVAKPANSLIVRPTVAANDGAAVHGISGLAGLAGNATRNADGDDDHEAEVERSAIISADGASYWEADGMAGLPAWTEAEVNAFETRVARIAWLGYPDAKGRAERLLHRDRDADDRRLCVECAHAGPGWRCAKREAFLLDQLQRCPMFET